MNEKKVSEARQACAACKHQRRKCHKNCLLAPYFPSSQFQDFMNAHKLFGVSNITKILNQIEPNQRGEAIKSILIESKARKDDPVLGIVGIIQNLRTQIQLCEEELGRVNEKVSCCRQLSYHQRHNEQLQSQQQLIHLLASSSSSSSSPLFHQYCFDDQYNHQMLDIYDSNNIESYTLERDIKEFNQEYEEYEDVKPLDVRMMDDFQLKKEAV